MRRQIQQGAVAPGLFGVKTELGGNFGIRNSTYPEFVLVAWAARRIGRPVKWTCERRDAFATDFHRRGLTADVELALDQYGRFLAIRGINTSNFGRQRDFFCPACQGDSRLLQRLPLAAAGVRVCIDDRARIAHTKTMVIDGAGHRPRPYNWTRGAAENSEDLNLISSPTVAAAYSAHWRQRLAVSAPFVGREGWCRALSAEVR